MPRSTACETQTASAARARSGSLGNHGRADDDAGRSSRGRGERRSPRWRARAACCRGDRTRGSRFRTRGRGGGRDAARREADARLEEERRRLAAWRKRLERESERLAEWERSTRLKTRPPSLARRRSKRGCGGWPTRSVAVPPGSFLDRAASPLLDSEARDRAHGRGIRRVCPDQRDADPAVPARLSGEAHGLVHRRVRALHRWHARHGGVRREETEHEAAAETHATETEPSEPPPAEPPPPTETGAAGGAMPPAR